MKLFNGRKFGWWEVTELESIEALKIRGCVSDLHDFIHSSQTLVSASVLISIILYRCLSCHRKDLVSLSARPPNIPGRHLLYIFLPSLRMEETKSFQVVFFGFLNQ